MRRNLRERQKEHEGVCFKLNKCYISNYLLNQGCQYPYLNMNQSLPLCNPNDKTRQSRLTYGKVKVSDYAKPCHRISKIRYELKQYEMGNLFTIFMKYPEEIKMITQSKEVDIHSLIGNVGGYIGVFVGKIEIENFLK